MKKKNILLIILIILILLAAFILYFLFDKKLNNKESNNDNLNNDISNQENTLESEEISDLPIEELNKYIDENPVKLGIYVQKGNTKQLIQNEYTCGWAPEEIMGLFFAVPTTEKSIPNTNFSTLWKEYINKYPNPEKYRIGYSIKFTLNTGEVIDRTILNPGDAYHMFPKVMVFLYDDVNFVSGQRYYHITDMTDNTICSSIKLVGDVETKNIISDIELTAFSFDSKDDFDEESNKYRGNSSYTITIKRR